ncbi:MAG: hypothetical protein KGI60_03655, partial [Patescibacteria group bacterium]|nr:hypothetical protein [Patescibacteria group bacterium]
HPPHMNLLAAATQAWADPKTLFTLSPADFDPAPEVHSAVIELVTKGSQLAAKETESYYRFVHVIFKQPRKTIFNNLREGLDLPQEKIKSALESLGLDPQSRPQNLSVDQIFSLSQNLL